MQLKTFVVLIFLVFLLAFVVNKYTQAGNLNFLEQRVKIMRESVLNRTDQFDKINKELEGDKWKKK